MKFILKSIIITVLLLIGNLVRVSASYANDLVDSIQTVRQELTEEEQVQFLLENCWKYRQLQPSKALKLGELALELIQSNKKYNHHFGTIYNYLGVIYLNYLYNAKTAMPFFYNALEKSIEFKDSTRMAYAYNNIGDIYFVIKNIPLSIDNSFKAFRIFESLNDHLGMSYSSCNLGTAYRTIKKFDRSLEYLKIDYSHSLFLKDSIRMANAFYEMGVTYFEKNNLDLSMQYFQYSLEILEERPFITIRSNCLNGIANIYSKKNEFEKALSYYQQSLQINYQHNYFDGLINNYEGLALLYAKMGNQKKCFETYEMGFSLANQIGFPIYVLKISKLKPQLYSILNDYENSVKSYEQYLAVYDSTFAMQNFETIEQVEKNLQKTTKINNYVADLKTNARERIYLLIIILLLVLFVLFIILRNRKIAKLNRRLSEINSTKDKLFSIIAHDLRSPFHIALGFSSLILIDLERKEYGEVSKYSTLLNDSLNSTYKLIVNLLNWSQTQRGILKSNPKLINIQELANEVLSLFIIQMQAKNVKTSIKVVGKAIAYADKDAISTVLTNLISNAIKFLNNEGLLKIEMEEEGSHLVIQIIDNGVGIEPEKIRHLFSISNSKSTRGTNNEKGIGLGLIICKELIDINNGEISVQSKLNKGTTFILRLPKQ